MTIKNYFYKPVVNYFFEDSLETIDYSPKLNIFDNILQCALNEKESYLLNENGSYISKSLYNFSQNPYIYLPHKGSCYLYNSEF